MPPRTTNRKRVRRSRRTLTVSKKYIGRRNVPTTALTHRFTRYFNSGVVNGNALHLPYLSAASFSLSQIPNVGEFTALFDMYKITFVQLRFHLNIDPSAQPAATSVYPKLYYATDYDDSTAPSSLDDLRQHARMKVRVLTPNRPVIVNIRPAIASTVYQTAVSSTYSPKWRQWVDCQNSSTPHYGLKWGIDNLTNTAYNVQIEGRMWFSCKDVR